MFKEEKATQPEPEEDSWTNEHSNAKHNHNQEYTRTQYIYIKSKFPTFTITVLTIIICIVLGIDIYNTVSENDKTVINTIIGNFIESSDYFAVDTGYFDTDTGNFIVDNESEDSYSIVTDHHGNIIGGNKIPEEFLTAEEKRNLYENKLKNNEEEKWNTDAIFSSITAISIILLIIYCLCKKEKTTLTLDRIEELKKTDRI